MIMINDIIASIDEAAAGSLPLNIPSCLCQNNMANTDNKISNLINIWLDIKFAYFSIVLSRDTYTPNTNGKIYIVNHHE